MIGIELSWERLWTLRRLVFGLGSLQVVACAAVLGGIAFALGAEPAPAAFVGVALALSSTAIVVPVLAAQKRLASPTGRATFSVLLFQDLAVAPGDQSRIGAYLGCYRCAAPDEGCRFDQIGSIG